MGNYELLDVGENNVEIKWLGKHTIRNLQDLKKCYSNMDFISSSITTKQCKQFFADLKKALKKELGTEYTVNADLGHFYVSGFVSKNGKFVYFSIEDLRENGVEFNHILYRTAKNDKDYTGGDNRYCNLENLKNCIKDLLEN